MMNLWNFLIEIPSKLEPFFSFILEPIPVLGFSPLGLFSFLGISAILTIHIARLFIS